MTPEEGLTATRDPGSVQDVPPDPRRERAALIVFVAFLVAAVPIVLFGVGSYHWFFRDDFFFLAGRKLTSANDLFRPHNAHWSTVPVIAFRILCSLFGLRSYIPYQATVLALHLSACALLRVIMRRHGVGPWVATIAAGAFVLFGPGEQNIIWAFQIGFTGSLTFGLAQLVLIDHDGPFDTRDALGVLAGALSLLSSGVGIAMAVVAGIATLGRRGWRVALLQTGPIAAIYVAWWTVERPDLTSAFGRPTIPVLIRWVWSGEIGVFLALGHFQVVALLLALVFVAGLALAWMRLDWSSLRRRGSVPAAMFVGGLVFSSFSATGRWFLGSHFARSSRYVHVGAALALPVIAVAVDAIFRRRREVGVAATALLLIAIPWNSTHFGRDSAFGSSYMSAREQVIKNVVRLPEAAEVPRDVRPIPDVYVGPDLTIGFLLGAVHSGRLHPDTKPISPGFELELRLRLGVAQRVAATPTGCHDRTGPFDVTPTKGTVYGITAPVRISMRDNSGRRSRVLVFNPGEGRSLTVELPGLHLRFAPAAGGRTVTLCSGT